MNRTTFIIDGFNLYHSVVEASWDLHNASTKWLDIHSLCKSYLHVIGNNSQIENIYYFSALAYHLQQNYPGKIHRHKLFIKALESTGIIVKLGRFKTKEMYCDTCKKMITKHEEKETDVAMATTIFEILIKNDADTIVIISGDTDLAPVIRTAKDLFPKINIIFAFPYNRVNRELKILSPKSFNINKESYLRHQFKEQIFYKGETLIKPENW
ncbi:MAG: NYN domain-containing protein [FCB group bacterium]|jgi:uncharacterized LabA/DUF88 family protein